MNIKKYLRILLPIVIVLIVAAIWVYKNPTTPVAESAGTVPITDITEESNDDQLVTDDEIDTATQDIAYEELFTLSISVLDLELLATYELPVIIDFGADYCVPCQMMTPILATIHEEMGERAFIKYVDVSEYPELTADFPISVIPTQIFFNSDGTPYDPSEEIADAIAFTKYSLSGTDDHALTLHQGILTEDEMRTILADMGVT